MLLGKKCARTSLNLVVYFSSLNLVYRRTACTTVRMQIWKGSIAKHTPEPDTASTAGCV